MIDVAVMLTYKTETVKQLRTRRDTVQRTLDFAVSKINALTGQDLAPTSQAMLDENKAAKTRCELELAKIDGCIKWLNGLK